MKKSMNLILVLLLLITLLGGSKEYSAKTGISIDSTAQILSNYDVDQLSFQACGFEIDTQSNKELTYEGEISDPKVIDKLWNIINEQQKQKKIRDGNYASGTPYILIHNKNGEDNTVSYTWNREEKVSDDSGEPGIEPVGTAFVISGTSSEKYEVVSVQLQKEFEETIMSYLRNNVQPKEKIWMKTAKTDSIVFVSCYRNWATRYQCNGSFIDCWGNEYEFDYSNRKAMNDEEFKEALWETYCNQDPGQRDKCDSKKLFDILINDVYTIDSNAKMSKKSVGCDAGQRTLYVCDSDFNMIELRSSGDWEEELQDNTAKELCLFYDSIQK